MVVVHLRDDDPPYPRPCQVARVIPIYDTRHAPPPRVTRHRAWLYPYDRRIPQPEPRTIIVMYWEVWTC
eukprot:scaffold57386_cov66-Cyclotella_meneghiniana.AAC.4